LDTIERLLIAIQADTEKEELSKLRVYILFKLANKMKELEKETTNVKPVQKTSSTAREKPTNAPSPVPEKEAPRINSPQFTEEQRQYLQQQQLHAQQQQLAQQHLLHQQQLQQQQLFQQQQQQQILYQQYQRQQQQHSNQMDIE
jgi:cell division protein FtsN